MKVMRALAIVALLCATATAARPLKQSTATTIIVGPFLSSTDGITPQTALTVGNIDCDLYKNGGVKTDVTLTATGGSNDCAHVANGYYSLELTATDTSTGGYLRISMNVSGAIPYFEDIEIKSANPYDSEYGTAIRAANVTQLGGNTQSGTDLKHFADTGYNPTGGYIEATAVVGVIGANGIQEASFANDAIAARAIANGAMNKGAEVAGFNDVSAATVRTQVDDGLTAYGGPTNTQMEARTLPSATYFNAATDKVFLGNGAHGGAAAVLTLSDYSSFQADVAGALATYGTATAAGVTAGFTEIKGAGWLAPTDTLQAIRARGDAAWVTATGFSTLTGSDTIGVNFGNVLGILQSANVANDILGQSPPANWSGLSISAGNVNAMVQGYLATAITETNAGDIARSLGFFYNVTPTTIKTVNDVGGGAGGGEADWTTNERSQIREALGVTGTTLATTGSGHLDGIKVKTDPMTYTKPSELDVNITSINQIEIIGAGRNPPFGVPP